MGIYWKNSPRAQHGVQVMGMRDFFFFCKNQTLKSAKDPKDFCSWTGRPTKRPKDLCPWTGPKDQRKDLCNRPLAFASDFFHPNSIRWLTGQTWGREGGERECKCELLTRNDHLVATRWTLGRFFQEWKEGKTFFSSLVSNFFSFFLHSRQTFGLLWLLLVLMHWVVSVSFFFFDPIRKCPFRFRFCSFFVFYLIFRLEVGGKNGF